MTPSRFRTTELSDPRFEAPNRRTLTVHSTNLRGRGDICLYVPEAPGENLPLVILLHGVYGSAWVWNLKGGASATTHRLIETEEIPPVVVATPSDGLWEDGSGYLPHHARDFEAWIVEDVIAAVRENIVGVGEASPVFIAGLSMGGYGALRLGAKYPEVFAGFSGHSSITKLDDFADFVAYDTSVYDQTGQAAVLDQCLANRTTLTPFRFDCGTEDPLLVANQQLHAALLAENIPHEYAEFPGGHEWPYWTEHLEDSLRFFARLLSLLLILALPAGLVAQNETPPPHVVLVLADDIGLGDISGYRRRSGGAVVVETPHLDALMRSGMAFTDGHSPNALCAPSRYAIMTGNNTYHSYAPWGVWGAYQPTPIEDEDLTLGELMRAAGYRTAFLGKWHLGGDFYRRGTEEIYRGDRSRTQLDVDVTRIVGGGPRQQGFDYSLLMPAGIQDVPYAVYENGEWLRLGEDSEIIEITRKRMLARGVKLDKDEGLGDSNWHPANAGPLLVRKATEVIGKATPEQPLFLYYCTQAVHKPHTPPDSLGGVAIRGTTPTPHLDMIRELDVQIGMLIRALKERGIYENTLFLFSSDNGGLDFAETRETGHRPSDVYRGGKNQIFEGGHRVPFLASWPGHIPAATTSDQLISGTDILATLAALTGQTLSAGQGKDSRNFLATLLGDDDPPAREHLLLQGGTGSRVIYRDGPWKLIMQYDRKADVITPVSLFNLKENVAESPSGDLIADPGQQKRIQDMHARYVTIRTEKQRTGDPVEPPKP